MIELISQLFTRFLPFLNNKAAVYLLGFILIIAASGYGGWWLRDTKVELEKLNAIEKALKQAKVQQDIDMEIFKKSIQKQKEIQIVYKKIKGDTKYVEVNNCVDLGDDWRRLYNDAVNATSTADSN